MKLNNIKINCISNFNSKIRDSISFSDYRNSILYYRPNIETKKALNIKEYFFEKELKHKKILIDINKAKKYKNTFTMKRNLKAKTKKIVIWLNINHRIM